MNEFQLKYGTNPNQKPARIYMADGSDLPVQILNGRPGYINFLDAFNSWQLVRDLKKALGQPVVVDNPFGLTVPFNVAAVAAMPLAAPVVTVGPVGHADVVNVTSAPSVVPPALVPFARA